MNKTLAIALGSLLVLSTVALIVFKSKKLETSYSDDVLEKWKQFKATYKVRFADPDYEAYRIGVFSENLKATSQDSSFGVTQFMALTPAEFKATYLTLQAPQTTATDDVQAITADVNVDWVAVGKVTDVKNQGQCGSCWSFSTTGSVESALILFGNQPRTISLSEQELVDCSTSFGNQGCNGGLMDQAFQYIQKNKLSIGSQYPYTAKDGQCKDTTQNTKFTISSYQDVKANDCNALVQALSTQPISIAVDATSWQYYTGGVLKTCGTNLDHGVLLVGYSNNAYTVKNSWGTSWGEKGFIRLDASQNANICGICQAASFPKP